MRYLLIAICYITVDQIEARLCERLQPIEAEIERRKNNIKAYRKYLGIK